MKYTRLNCLGCGKWWVLEEGPVRCICEEGVWVIDEEGEGEWGIS